MIVCYSAVTCAGLDLWYSHVSGFTAFNGITCVSREKDDN